MKKVNSSLIFLVILVFACKSKNPQVDHLIIPEESTNSATLSSLVQEVSYIPLTGDPSQLPNEIDKAMFMDQLIILGDFNFSQSLYAFDKQSGEFVPMPLRKGEGPNEAREISDFWIDKNFIYVLDGIGRKILPIKFENGGFILQDPIGLELPLRKFAKIDSGFVGITGGGQDFTLVFVNPNGKVTTKHLPFSIEYLMNPMNPFHQVKDGEKSTTLLHTQFSPIIYKVDQGELVEFKRFSYGGEPLAFPAKTDFPLDQEGFNQFRSTLQSQPSFFTLFEKTANQFLLFHILNEVPKMALVDGDSGVSFSFQNIKNDISFDQPFPKVIGINEDKFVAFISKEQINPTSAEFENSSLKTIIDSNPNSLIFLVQFKLRLNSE